MKFINFSVLRFGYDWFDVEHGPVCHCFPSFQGNNAGKLNYTHFEEVGRLLDCILEDWEDSANLLKLQLNSFKKVLIKYIRFQRKIRMFKPWLIMRGVFLLLGFIGLFVTILAHQNAVEIVTGFLGLFISGYSWIIIFSLYEEYRTNTEYQPIISE